MDLGADRFSSKAKQPSLDMVVQAKTPTELVDGFRRYTAPREKWA